MSVRVNRLPAAIAADPGVATGGGTPTEEDGRELPPGVGAAGGMGGSWDDPGVGAAGGGGMVLLPGVGAAGGGAEYPVGADGGGGNCVELPGVGAAGGMLGMGWVGAGGGGPLPGVATGGGIPATLLRWTVLPPFCGYSKTRTKTSWHFLASRGLSNSRAAM